MRSLPRSPCMAFSLLPSSFLLIKNTGHSRRQSVLKLELMETVASSHHGSHHEARTTHNLGEAALEPLA